MNILDKYPFLKEIPTAILYELLVKLKEIPEEEKDEIIDQLKNSIVEKKDRRKRDDKKRGCLFFIILLIVIGIIAFGVHHLCTTKQEVTQELIIERTGVDTLISELINKYDADTTWKQSYENFDFNKHIYIHMIKNELMKKEYIFVRAIVVEVDSVDSSFIVSFKSVVDLLKPSFTFVLNSNRESIDSIIKHPSRIGITYLYGFGDYAIVAKINGVRRSSTNIDNMGEANFIAWGELIDFVYLGDNFKYVP